MSTLKKQLQMEKEDKRDLVNKLKKQLDVHQEHVRKLKAEVSATTKHQVWPKSSPIKKDSFSCCFYLSNNG